MSAAAKLLDRLERVKQTGPRRWIAACPSHRDRSPSLSIRELDSGLVLLHDFGGCGTGVCLGCAVPLRLGTYDRACREGPVYRAADVAWERLPSQLHYEAMA